MTHGTASVFNADSRLNLAMLTGGTLIAQAFATQTVIGVDTDPWALNGFGGVSGPAQAGNDLSLNEDGATINVANEATLLIRFGYQLQPTVTQTLYMGFASLVGVIGGDTDGMSISAVGGDDQDLVCDYLMRFSAGASFKIFVQASTAVEHLDGCEIDIVRIA